MLQRAISLHQEGRLAEAAELYIQILGQTPGHAEASHLLGVIELQRNNPLAALALIDRAIESDPNNAAYYSNRGIALQGLARFNDAIASYDHALTINPVDADAYLNRGNALRDLMRFDEALASYDRALVIWPDRPEALINRGLALRDLNRFHDALASYDRALAIKPGDADALNNRGNALQDMGHFEEAVTNYDQALAIAPGRADTLANRGNALLKLQRFVDALASYDATLATRPNFSPALLGRGTALQALGRFADALASYDRILSVSPNSPEAHFGRGNALASLRRFDDAIASYNRALANKPDYVEALLGRGNALGDSRHFIDALANFEHVLAIRPDNAEALVGRGNALADLGYFNEAIASFDRALEIRPDLTFLFAVRLHIKSQICQWSELAVDVEHLVETISGGRNASEPFPLLATPLSAALQRANSEIYVRERYPKSSLLSPFAGQYVHDRIRVGYFSADFHAHATAYLIAEMIERHDRKRFEVIAFGFGGPRKDAMRERLEKAFDRFIDVSDFSDEEVAILARKLEIDIAVDLKGFTRDNRTGIFALGAAPIQIHYLGYPGTMGAEYIDYLIADSTLIAEEDRKHYSEKIAYLPDTYQANDSTRGVADAGLTRANCGLPMSGFVFCCFNSIYKISPGMFDIWMRLLNRVEGSVLWLLKDNDAGAENLRIGARARGIEANRLVFTERIDMPGHLARQRLADLFLDTLPYNAHTTASDALLAGLPVLTCFGETFPGRVGASLLKAIGMSDLITHDLDEYEALALRLATEPQQLSLLRKKLAANRFTHPLFDTARFTRHIESAYEAMWERYQAGLAPEHINVLT